MANEIERPGSSAARVGDGVDPVAMAVALGGASRDEADAFLKKHGRIADLQIEDLKRENKLRHWSLVVHHISDVIKVTFELAVAGIALAILVAIGAAVWSAAHDNGLVIDAFSVPPDMAAKGLTGEAIATQVQDRLSWMQANTDSVRAANTFRNNWGDDVKVQIPDTGVSVGEFYRYLAAWLGHETHITGEVYHGAKGLTVLARAGNGVGQKYSGADAGLDALVAKAAEDVYLQTQPYRYAVFLLGQNRPLESTQVVRSLALRGPPEEKPWAYTLWGLALGSQGDQRAAAEMERVAARLGPELANVFFNLGGAEAGLGHDEAELRDNRRALELFQGPAARQLASYAVAIQIPNTTIMIAAETGDYSGVSAQVVKIEALSDYNFAHLSAIPEMANDLAKNHDVAASQRVDGRDIKNDGYAIHLVETRATNTDLVPLPVLSRAAALDDWITARDDLIADDNLPDARRIDFKIELRILNWPWLALAQAKLGDFASAHALIDRTPGDCYLCLRMRGNIDATQKNWRGANYWFGRAVQQAPSIPFAYVDWGQMLLTKDDLDGAIAKFTLANQKGPHFADPLEMWGEVLMAKNRSDLALAKFEEANQYAPNWGRLHLKWGEAFFYLGRKDEAKKQFAIAPRLDLSAADRAALQAWIKRHG